MKKLFVLLICFVVAFGAAANAEPWRVFDNAGLFTQEETEEIEQAIFEFQRITNYDFAFLSTDDYLGKDSAEIGKAFYTAENLGFGQNGSGVLYYIAIYNNGIKPTVICGGNMCSVFDIDKRKSALEICDALIVNTSYKEAVLKMLEFALEAVKDAT